MNRVKLIIHLDKLDIELKYFESRLIKLVIKPNQLSNPLSFSQMKNIETIVNFLWALFQNVGNTLENQSIRLSFSIERLTINIIPE